MVQTATIDTSNMKQITKDQLDYLLNPKEDGLSDDYFMLLNDVSSEDVKVWQSDFDPQQ